MGSFLAPDGKALRAVGCQKTPHKNLPQNPHYTCVSFLAETSGSVEIGACSFQSRCEVYNEVHRAKDNSRLSPLMSCFSRKPQSALRDDCWELNEQRLEEGYFWWSLVNFYEEVSLLHCTNLFCARSKESCRRDIEQLCEKAWVHV